jgi:predicted HTH transcriptional regulator
MKIKELIQQPEGRKIEFKEALPKKSDLNKTVVAFANDAGGDLFIGIKDSPRQIVGVNEDELVQIEEDVSNIIHNNCEPIILPEISFIRIDDKPIIRIKIYKGNNPPYYIKSKGKEKGTYIRVGSVNKLATSDIIKELELQKLNISFDSLPVLQKSLSVLNYQTLKQHFEETTGEELTLNVLKKLKLIHEQNSDIYPTNALILLSEDELRQHLFPYAKIECARFKGTVPGDFIDQKTIHIAKINGW